MIDRLNLFEKKVFSLITNIFLFYMFFAFIFSRSFVGIYIFDFRIGELIVGLTLIIFIYSLIFDFQNNRLKVFDKNFRKIWILIFFSFLLIAFYSNSNFFSTYTYKSSSYIWTISAFILGVNSKKINLSIKQLALFEIILLSIFFISIYDFPNILIDFFVKYSDKYEPHKGSDLGLFFIIVNLLINKSLKYNRTSLNIFILNLGFFSPLILYRSRGAFIGVVIFVLYQFLLFNKNKVIVSIKTIPMFVIFLFIATYSTVVSQVKDFPEEVSAEVISESYASLGQYRLQHYQEEYPILYYENGRFFSGDGNLNWRLDMWQDQIEFMVDQNLVIFGSGYKDKLYVFETNNTGYGNDRTGLDNTNENIHNFFIQIFSRGGLLQLFIYIYLFFNIYKTYFQNTSKRDILFYLLPLIWISLFDSSMENAHFPIIFYYFLGNFYFLNKSDYS